ncbi:8-amino-7-oxononanoate synthase [Vibrio stylophorae]|uniref:8-amino-7-oxononanoate synthase n=1 Tax=Vibrio stylophorae TaxID=659351 RepID=A0ABN8DSA1_9VIBR|nr:8-amino-7-oxononanoate synthase [Vibrio stylophorae]CAH0533423.1 8-amino-7-oxononanoate synthase [Vibrio stylophorae]
MTRLFNQRQQAALMARRAQGLYRQHAVFAGGMLNFASNDYLGLSQHKAVIAAWQQAAKAGVGATASPAVVGFHATHQALVASLCDWLGFEDALLFNSGFSANQTLLHTVVEPQDRLFQDKLNHASLIDAGLHTKAHHRRFAHNDSQALARLIKKHNAQAGQDWVVTEGIFSMDGDSAPLTELSALCQQQGAALILDDAHGIGVTGEQGRGSCDVAKIKPDYLMVTFGKALGIGGAAILSTQQNIDYLRQFSRHYVYSTAMPIAQAAAIQCAIEIVRWQPELREKLQNNSAYFDQGLRQLATEFGELGTASMPALMSARMPTLAIKPVILKSSVRTMHIARHLAAQGIQVGAIRPPTVAPNSARLRICLSAAHTEAHIDKLLNELRHALAQPQPIENLSQELAC